MGEKTIGLIWAVTSAAAGVVFEGMIGRGALTTRHADTPKDACDGAFQGSVQCLGPLSMDWTAVSGTARQLAGGSFDWGLTHRG